MKIGTLCPAQLTVHIEASKVTVRCSISHYGHEISLKDIRISRLELETIKGRILEGVTLDRILSVSLVRLIYLFPQLKDVCNFCRMHKRSLQIDCIVPEEIAELFELEHGNTLVHMVRLCLLSLDQIRSLSRRLNVTGARDPVDRNSVSEKWFHNKKYSISFFNAVGLTTYRQYNEIEERKKFNVYVIFGQTRLGRYEKN